MINKYSFIIISLLFFNYHSEGIEKIDSLKTILSNTQEDSIKLKIYQQIADYYNQTNPDSSMFYYEKRLKLAKKLNNQKVISESLRAIGTTFLLQSKYQDALTHYLQALKIDSINHNINQMAMDMNSIANVYMYQSKYDKALEYYKKALELYKKSKKKNGIASVLGNMGIIYKKQGNYSAALKNYLKALQIYENMNLKTGIANQLTNIGIIYMYLNNQKKALEYYKKALTIFKKMGNEYAMSVILSNIGIIYDNQKKYNKALEYYKKALKIKKRLGNKYGISIILTNIGSVYYALAEYNKALKYFLEALKIQQEIGDQTGSAAVFTNIGNIYEKLKKYDKAIEYTKKGLQLAKKVGSLDDEKTAYAVLLDIYIDKKDCENVKKYKKLWKAINDTIFSDEKAKAIAEIQEKYEAAKREKEIIKQKAELEKKQLLLKKEKAERAKQQAQKRMLGIALLFALILSTVVFYSYKQKSKANTLLKKQKQEITKANIKLREKNKEITQQKREIEAQRDEIEIQKNIVIRQKEQIEYILDNLNESINYAKHLQHSILPTENLLKKHFSEHFILFMPKEKVSGDFYWWTNVGNYTIIAVVDCTGHGIPGAFMSMLGISFLDEIVNKKQIVDTATILNKLRKSVIDALHQTDETRTHKDGMDMAIVSINNSTGIYQYSGANNPLYVITNNNIEILNKHNNIIKTKESENSQQNLYIFKPDKMPIGVYDKMDNFKSSEFKLHKDDSFYLFTDGFIDQFGGHKETKFKSKQFKSLLLSISCFPMSKQGKILKETFLDWKNGLEQIDDVTIVGIRI